MRTCANSHKCIISTHTEAPHTHGWRVESTRKTPTVYTRYGEKSEHLLDLSICIHFSSIILCKLFFSVVLRTFLLSWFGNGPTREIRDSCDGCTGSSSVPLDSRVGKITRHESYTKLQMKISLDENTDMSYHNESEIGENSSDNLWEQSSISERYSGDSSEIIHLIRSFIITNWHNVCVYFGQFSQHSYSFQSHLIESSKLAEATSHIQAIFLSSQTNSLLVQWTSIIIQFFSLRSHCRVLTTIRTFFVFLWRFEFFLRILSVTTGDSHSRL